MTIWRRWISGGASAPARVLAGRFVPGGASALLRASRAELSGKVHSKRKIPAQKTRYPTGSAQRRESPRVGRFCDLAFFLESDPASRNSLPRRGFIRGIPRFLCQDCRDSLYFFENVERETPGCQGTLRQGAPWQSDTAPRDPVLSMPAKGARLLASNLSPLSEGASFPAVYFLTWRGFSLRHLSPAW